MTTLKNLKGPIQLKQLVATIETGESQQNKQKHEQNQNQNFYCHIFNFIFLLTQHSSIFQIIS